MEAFRAVNFVMAAVASIPGLIYKGLVLLCRGLYLLFTVPCEFTYLHCWIPVWTVCCRPGGCLYALKECNVDCCDSCRRCCCRTATDAGSYGAGV